MMRFLLKVHVPVEAGNAGVMDGSILTKIQSYLNAVKPEAGYFFAENGQRAFYLIINLDRPEQLPEIAEPLWLDLKANVEAIPVMNMEDFAKAGAGIQRVVAARR
jgi:hypothetical protein